MAYESRFTSLSADDIISMARAQFFAPSNRFLPPLRAVCASAVGFVSRKFDGENMSGIWRVMQVLI